MSLQTKKLWRLTQKRAEEKDPEEIQKITDKYTRNPAVSECR